jgi:hypothetical protein
MKYYGVRYAKAAHPSDLWVTYFTSSSYVKDYAAIHGAPDIVQIRKTFVGENRVREAKLFEHRVLCRLDVASRDDYLNKSNMNSLDTTKLDDPAVQARWASSMNLVRNDPRVKAKRREVFQQNAVERAKADPRVYEFVNVKTAQTITCSITHLAITYGLNITMLCVMANGDRKTVGGWRIAAYDPTNGNTDRTKYKFEHNDGHTEYCTRKEMEKKYSINSGNLSEMMNGNRKTCRGWRVINTK